MRVMNGQRGDGGGAAVGAVALHLAARGIEGDIGAAGMRCLFHDQRVGAEALGGVGQLRDQLAAAGYTGGIGQMQARDRYKRHSTVAH